MRSGFNNLPAILETEPILFDAMKMDLKAATTVFNPETTGVEAPPTCKTEAATLKGVWTLIFLAMPIVAVSFPIVFVVWTVGKDGYNLFLISALLPPQFRQ